MATNNHQPSKSSTGIYSNVEPPKASSRVKKSSASYYNGHNQVREKNEQAYQNYQNNSHKSRYNDQDIHDRERNQTKSQYKSKNEQDNGMNTNPKYRGEYPASSASSRQVVDHVHNTNQYQESQRLNMPKNDYSNGPTGHSKRTTQDDYKRPEYGDKNQHANERYSSQTSVNIHGSSTQVNKYPESYYKDKHQRNTMSYKDNAANGPNDVKQVTSWEPKARRNPSESDTKSDVPSWEPRANRKKSDNRYTSQNSLCNNEGTELSVHASQANISKAKSMQESSTSDVEMQSKKQPKLQDDANAPSQVNRRYQRNSAYNPNQNRHSKHQSMPYGSTQSLNIISSQPMGHVNRGLSVSSVSLSPSGAGLAGQADLGVSSSRLSLASVNISRNPSLASLVASNPSLYRTVSALSLYETGTVKPNHYLPVTVAGCILCPPIGVIGILFSVMAKDAINSKDYPGAVKWGSVALWSGVAFIIGGIVMIITLSLILGLYHS